MVPGYLPGMFALVSVVALSLAGIGLAFLMWAELPRKGL